MLVKKPDSQLLCFTGKHIIQCSFFGGWGEGNLFAFNFETSYGDQAGLELKSYASLNLTLEC